MTGSRIARSIAAGFCGSIAHSALMFLKSWTGLLPTFQPYVDLQAALSRLVGGSVHPAVPWLLSFVNGAVILGFLFGRLHAWLPGRSGAIKGLVFGLFGWAAMGLLFFPLLGRGPFALQLGLSVAPAFFSLAMVLTYGVIMGVAYSVFASSAVSRR
jgi:hypothetical protein